MDSQLVNLLAQITALTVFAGVFTTVLVEGVKRSIPDITPLYTNLSALLISLIIVALALIGIDVAWVPSTFAMGGLASVLVFGTAVGIHEVYTNYRNRPL